VADQTVDPAALLVFFSLLLFLGIAFCRGLGGDAVSVLWSLHKVTQVVGIIMHDMVGYHSEVLMQMLRLKMTEHTVANGPCR